MIKLFANSGDPDQMLHSVVYDLGLHPGRPRLSLRSRSRHTVFKFFKCFISTVTPHRGIRFGT